MWGYKDGCSLEQRRQFVEKILKKYPDRVPIVLEKKFWEQKDFEISHKKFLIPSDLTMGHVYYLVRKREQMPAEEGLFFSIKNHMPMTSATLGSIYENFKSKDKLLYITYSQERKFG